MAVVTLKYTRNKAQIKAHLRYITHRRGETRAKITRTLFSETGLTDKREAYHLIDGARRGTLFYKLVISPDPAQEDTRKDLDLQHITRQTLQAIEKRIGRRLRFVATVHHDHTPLRHVHGFFLIDQRLTRDEFKSLSLTARHAATRAARLQRKARDRVREAPRYQRLAQTLRWARRARGRKSPHWQPACAACGYGQFTGLPGHLTYCPLCHTRLKQERTERLELGGQT